MVATMPVPGGGVLPRRDVHLMAVVLGLALVALWAFGERIPVNEGFGFGDGRTYGRLGMSLPSFVLGGNLDQYRMARLLPAALVYIANKVLPLQPTVGSTVFLFRLLNVALLVLAAISWGRLARRLSFDRLAAWIGFVGVFANFAVLKMALYYPTLTDVPALALSMFLLHAYVSRAVWAVGGLTALAAWTHPTVFLLGILLFLFPRSIDGERRTGIVGLSRLLAGLISVGVVAVIWIADGRLGDTPVPGAAPVWRSWFAISVGAVALYVFMLLQEPLKVLVGRLVRWRSEPLTGRAVGVAALRSFVILDVVVIALLTYQLGRVNPAHEAGMIAFRFVHQAAARPLVFLVAHVLYFGPIVVLAGVVWRRAIRIVGSLGAGLIMAIAGLVILSLTSESRTLIAALPFLGVLAAAALDEQPPSTVQFGVFTGLSLLVSRFWLPINQGPFETGSRIEFPGQYYFGNFGPWMGPVVFGVFSVVAAVVLVAVVFLFRPRLVSDRGS